MTQYKQNKVSRAIWPWTEDNSKSTSSSQVSVIFALFIGGCAAGLFFYTGHLVPAAIVGILSMLLFGCALLLPQLYTKIRFFLNTFSFFVGQGLSWLLLVPFFYLFFPLGRLMQKICGKDPMNRKWPSTLPTYWLDRKGTSDVKQYLKQF